MTTRGTNGHSANPHEQKFPPLVRRWGVMEKESTPIPT